MEPKSLPGFVNVSASSATAVEELLEKLAADGRINSCTRGIYEPENARADI
jgi:hypothetical protein